MVYLIIIAIVLIVVASLPSAETRAKIRMVEAIEKSRYHESFVREEPGIDLFGNKVMWVTMHRACTNQDYTLPDYGNRFNRTTSFYCYGCGKVFQGDQQEQPWVK